MSPVRACRLLAGWCAIAVATAQQDPANPQVPQLPQLPQPTPGTNQPPGFDPRTGAGDPLREQNPVDPEGLHSVWLRPDAFQGFPVFPPNLSHYGMYPPPPGFMQPPEVTGELPPTVAPAPPDWPAWVRPRLPGELPYAPDIAVLVRQSDRVWWRLVGADPFVPLYHHDTTRALPVGAEVRVPHTGDFLLLLHGGGRLASVGTAELRVEGLAEQRAKLRLAAFTRVELVLFEGGAELVLPDGSQLLVAPVPAGAEGAAVAGNVRLFLDRTSEPDRYGGRATVWNGGDRAVRWRTGDGEVQLVPGHRVTFFLLPSRNLLPQALTEQFVQGQVLGQKRSWSTTDRGSVAWSGARFALGPAQQLVLDPMLGDPFAPPAPEPGATRKDALAPLRSPDPSARQ